METLVLPHKVCIVVMVVDFVDNGRDVVVVELVDNGRVVVDY